MSRSPEVRQQLRVDPVACEGVGLCAHVADRLVNLDPWGYPILEGDLRTAAAVREARRAVRACPRRALWLEEADRRR